LDNRNEKRRKPIEKERNQRKGKIKIKNEKIRKKLGRRKKD
jgi:hypothetical protein